MRLSRRDVMQLAAGAMLSGPAGLTPSWCRADSPSSAADPQPLKITGLKITPIALPDPPLLAAGGCHGPYFLRNIVEIETDAGVTGIGETKGGERNHAALEKAREVVLGRNAFGYRNFATQLSGATFAGIELACLDACGRATGRRLCELLGGPVREEVEYAAYLFFRYAADHPTLLKDRRIADDRGRGDAALDDWGEVRTPEAMADMAQGFHRRWGFRVQKLKAGVFPPKLEVAALRAISERFEHKLPLRIDPNGRWKVATAVEVAAQIKDLPLEYYEDPVRGQEAMAEVRRTTGLSLSTNSCVTRFEHIPPALKTQPIDVVLGDHHGWGGITAFQSLGRICQTVGWGLSQHSNNHAGITMAAMTHVGAVVPQLTYASDSHYPWLVEGADVIQGKNLTFKDGKQQVPRGAGVGVELDQDKLARAHEIYQKSGMKERDDAGTMRSVEPGWERSLF